MAQRFQSPFEAFFSATPEAYSGGFLYFYQTNSSTPLDTYNDPDLDISHVNANPVVLNSAGRPSSAIFLQNQLYRVTLKDSDGNSIWTADNVGSSDFATFSIRKVGSGSPSGVVAGTAASSGVLPTEYWDYTNHILYECTTTGVAATAGWTAINASAATPTVVPPQGYLTATPGTAIISADATSSTSIGYEPLVGNLMPIYNGSRHVPTEFSALTLTLVASHAASTIYDVFGFSNSGVVTLATGPAWSSSTAGSCSRGSGAGTTELTRLSGYWVNNVSMTGRNGSTTYSIGANLATYLGSIFIDSAAGQVTCHRAWGSSRKWGVWNYYNRQPLYLKAGDSTASWTYNSATIRAARGQSTNSLTVFCGMAEEFFDLSIIQNIDLADDGTITNGIGWNSTTAYTGRKGYIASSSGDVGQPLISGSPHGRYLQAPAIGINTVTALEACVAATNTFLGGEDDMVLSALWRG